MYFGFLVGSRYSQGPAPAPGATAWKLTLQGHRARPKALARQCSLIKIGSSDPVSTYNQPTPRKIPPPPTSSPVPSPGPGTKPAMPGGWLCAFPPLLSMGPHICISTSTTRELLWKNLSPIVLTLFLPAPFCLFTTRPMPQLQKACLGHHVGLGCFKEKLFWLTSLPSARAKALSTEPAEYLSSSWGEVRVPN